MQRKAVLIQKIPNAGASSRSGQSTTFKGLFSEEEGAKAGVEGRPALRVTGAGNR